MNFSGNEPQVKWSRENASLADPICLPHSINYAKHKIKKISKKKKKKKKTQSPVVWFAKVSQRLRQCLSSQVIEHMVHFGDWSLFILDCLQFFHILQVEYSGNLYRKKVRGRNTGSFPEQQLENKRPVVWFVRLAKVSQRLRECLSSQIIEHTVHFGESLLILDYLPGLGYSREFWIGVCREDS